VRRSWSTAAKQPNKTMATASGSNSMKRPMAH
jgi:hypothetical protein